MSRSKASSFTRARRGMSVAAACWVLAACGNVKEWEEKPGALTLRATPLPAVEGMPLTLSVVGSNVGPVSVYQGDALIAAFANVELDGRKSYTVTAVSDETPRAEAVGYDFKRLTADATGLDGVAGSSGGGVGGKAGSAGSSGAGNGGAGGSDGVSGNGGTSGAGGATGGGGSGEVPAVDNCPGMIAASTCSHPLGGSVQVTFFNKRTSGLAAFRRTLLPQPCKEESVGTIAPDSSLTIPNVEIGISLVVREDPSGTVVKEFEVPNTPSCVLVF